ncbi:hypothetical protein ABEF95_005469 [Exophiala dermatitidis]
MAVGRPAPGIWIAAQAFFIASILVVFTTATSSTIATATCPFRTVNYITHSLPQQCLPSSRKANATSSVTEATSYIDPESASIPHPSDRHANTTEVVLTTSTTSLSLEFTSTSSEDATITGEPAQSISSPPLPESTMSSAGASVGSTDDESPLEDGKFLSFEDWKRENLKKAGQSEHVGKGHGLDRDTRKRPNIVQESLDALGDDAEIDIDFSGFVSDSLESVAPRQSQSNHKLDETPSDVKPGSAPRAGVRQKDAGTTCKERFNYASFDCAASVLKTNPEAKSPSAVLGKNKDSYMLNECSAQNKFLILELCDDIAIDTIVLANFEFFSSTFRTFRVSVSDKYPVKIDKWKTLGTFEARNSRDVQAFLVENPVIWARYLRIEFLTHYGNEYYCPLSLVRVHGTTMLEDYKHDLESLQMEEDDVESQDSGESSAMDELVPEAVAEPLLKVTSEASLSNPPVVETSDLGPSDSFPIKPETPSVIHIPSTTSTMMPMPTSSANFSVPFDEPSMNEKAYGVCKSVDSPTTIKPEELQPAATGQTTNAVVVTSTSMPTTAETAGHSQHTTSTAPASNSTTTFADTQISSSIPDVANNSSISKDPTVTAVNNSMKPASSTTQATAAAPTIQESFFKSVQKRLQMLEANSSLSLQYIEEQSRALRDAFQKVDQRQMAKTTSFLEYLNTTVLNELRDFRQQYDQLWQSTVIELELQRERYQQENLAINARLGILADEVIFQKRMSILQMILILICLGLVIFSRGSLNSYLELPLVQSVLARSPSSKWLNLHSLETPSHSPGPSRSHSTRAERVRHGILKGHRRSTSEDSVTDTLSPSDLYSPPTPVSFDSPSEEEEGLDDGNRLGDPEFDPSLIERPGTSPPVLPGTETPPMSQSHGNIGHDMVDSALLSSSPSQIATTTPRVVVNDATPPTKRLTWQLPETWKDHGD